MVVGEQTLLGNVVSPRPVHDTTVPWIVQPDELSDCAPAPAMRRTTKIKAMRTNGTKNNRGVDISESASAMRIY